MTIWLLIPCLFTCFQTTRTANVCPVGCRCDNNLKSVNCAKGNLKDVPRGLPPDTEILSLDGNSISHVTALSLHNYRNLRTLDVSYNQITDIAQDAFSGNPQLQVLKITGNQLTTPPVQAFDSTNQLQELYLGENDISEISQDTFSVLRNLRSLDLRSNKIVSIPNGAFRKMPILRQLDLRENGLPNVTTHQFIGLRSLTQLLLAGNKISHVQNNAFDDLPNLELLDLGENDISQLDFRVLQTLRKLQGLKLNGNGIGSLADLNFALVPTLQEVYLGHNPISVIPRHIFKPLTVLEILYLDHLPNLEFIDYPAFCGLQSLRILDLGSNPLLSRIDKDLFKPLKNLETINLSFNNFTSFYQEAFMHFEHLTELILIGNPLNCNCAAKWLLKLVKDTKLPLLSPGLTCHAPENLVGYGIAHVLPQNLTCTKARVLNYTQHAFFKIGSEAVLKCLASGEPAPSITWVTPHRKVFKHNDYLSDVEVSDVTHDDVLINDFHKEHHWHDSVHYFYNTSHDRIQILANGDLYIDYVQRIDAGNYTCIAKNPGGNDTIYIRFQLNYLILKEVKITSLIIGFGGAGCFLALGLLVGLLRFLCNRCEKKERLERKTRTIRQLLDNLEAYKTHQLDKLKDNYGMHVSKMKEHALMHMEKMQRNYNQQLQKIRDNCATQMDKLRENYNTQMGKIKGYSSHQIDKIRENYNTQMIKIRDYGSVQLEKLRETYKMQHQHLIKILEAMNIDHCRGVVDTDCLHTDSALFDQLNLDARFDVLDLKTPSRNSVSDDEFVTAISDAEGISLEAYHPSENQSLRKYEGDVDNSGSDRSTPQFYDPHLTSDSDQATSDIDNDQVSVPDATQKLMSDVRDITNTDLKDDASMSSDASKNSTPEHHVVEITPPEITYSQIESNV